MAHRISPPRLSGYVAMAAAAGLSVWLIAAHGGGNTSSSVQIGPSAAARATPATTTAKPKLLNGADLKARIRSLGQPVFWAGPEAGTGYDLSEDARGDVIVRYLPSVGAKPVLTVATVPFRGAYEATQQLAAKPGAVSKVLPDGSLLYYRVDRPSTYVAYRNIDYLVEIDASSARRARQIARAGRLQPIE